MSEHDDHHHHAAGYAARLDAMRTAKDDLFRHAAGSPLPTDRRASFTGLPYFAPDERFRFPGLRLEPVPEADRVPFEIDTSDGRRRTAYRLGRLRFSVEGQDLAVTAYQVGEVSHGTLFVPFRDRTSGAETYGAGRYLDIEPERDGSYVLDFNLAYNPLCAYSDAYSCPLPPPENWLPVAIRAGELAGDEHD